MTSQKIIHLSCNGTTKQYTSNYEAKNFGRALTLGDRDLYLQRRSNLIEVFTFFGRYNLCTFNVKKVSQHARKRMTPVPTLQ
jgi:hypothetical protein